MASNLVIVESPAKAGTIGKYLGKDYQVIASMGHVRDLPASKLGVDTGDGFAPSYVIPPKARQVIKKLKEAAKGKKTIYLATDLDREGEAIAWHIAEALGLEGQKDIAIQRITFDEITEDAVRYAVAHPRDLNRELIDAQQARRVLDRLVGYTLSPILWKKIYKGLSAGRVQSAALRLIVEREREREDFKPQEYWSLDAELAEPNSPDTFLAKLVQYEGKKIETQTLTDSATVDGIIGSLQGETYVVADIETKITKRKPAPPYTTSTFQQDAVNKLNMTARSAMRAAQSLYEAGHITYMRTDSLNLASTAIEAIRGYVAIQYGKEYLPAKAVYYKSKSKNAQEAHEAIRPTHPERTSVSGNAAEQKVYDLIRRRALACQMQPADIEQTGVNVNAGKAVFRATGSRIVFPGFLVLGRDDKEDKTLPAALAVGNTLDLRKLLPEQHFTEPPPRYSEASLIKALEELGIGRPSTYAPTVATLMDRNYVRIEQKRLVPEEAGYMVTDLLKKHFPDIVDYSFTANMEERLDEVAEGKTEYASLLRGFWEPFEKQVKEGEGSIEKVTTHTETDTPCPNCGAPMLLRRSRFGTFLGCSKFPECKTILSTEPEKEDNAPSLICPHCGKALRSKRARRGIFYGCSGYPSCTFAIWKPEQMGNKIQELEKEGMEMPFKEQALASLAHTSTTE